MYNEKTKRRTNDETVLRRCGVIIGTFGIRLPFYCAQKEFISFPFVRFGRRVQYGVFYALCFKNLAFCNRFQRYCVLGQCVFAIFNADDDIFPLRHKNIQKSAAVFICIGVAVLFIAVTPGILPIYYKSAVLETVNGATALVKEYGPLHFIYALYVALYFVGMICVILYSIAKKNGCFSQIPRVFLGRGAGQYRYLGSGKMYSCAFLVLVGFLYNDRGLVAFAVRHR